MDVALLSYTFILKGAPHHPRPVSWVSAFQILISLFWFLSWVALVSVSKCFTTLVTDLSHKVLSFALDQVANKLNVV